MIDIIKYNHGIICQLFQAETIKLTTPPFRGVNWSTRRCVFFKTPTFCGVENKQVFALQPSLQGEAQENHVSTIFTLTSN